MNKSFAKPLQDPSTGVPSISAKGADSIMDGGLMVQFPAFECLIERPRENAWSLGRHP